MTSTKTFIHTPIEVQELTTETVDNKRLYKTPTGAKYPSVTTVLGELSKEAIMEWRRRVGEAEANKISARASRRGTSVHAMAEDYLNNKDPMKKKRMPDAIASFNSMKTILDESIGNVYCQEVPLFSDKLQTAGRVDLIADFDGELSIVDFKTSSKPKKADYIHNYFMQAAFYGAALYEMTGMTAKTGVILISVDQHEPQVFKINLYDWLPSFISARAEFREKFSY
jgi:ATP-dependent exoDNAse (exonuclease V) beta subunit